MDPLSDVLRTVRLSGAHFFRTTATGAWSVAAPSADRLTPRILPGSQHLISYHLVLNGNCWGGIAGEPLLPLAAGDVIVFPHGHAHLMGSAPHPGPELISVEAVPRFPQETTLGDPARADVTLVCGFFGCDREPFNPLCAALPTQMRVRGLIDGVVGTFARQVDAESREGRVGADSMLTRLAEIMFVEVLRRYLEALPEERGGWLAAVRDPVVGRALAQMHARPADRWTLVELARAAAASRTILAERFAALVGLPPMQYLTQWRMQVAAGKLRDTGAKIATVAEEVGYDSEAAFSRAFKKTTGKSPREWRGRG